MSTRTPQPDSEILLAWIEGELSPDQHRRVTQALSEDPSLRTRVDAMRLDRFSLSAMGDEPAPQGLLEGVADLLEREMLVSVGEMISHEPAGTIRQVRHRRRLHPARFALAASLLVVVGAGAWVGGTIWARRGVPTPNTQPLALTPVTPPSAGDDEHTTLADTHDALHAGQMPQTEQAVLAKADSPADSPTDFRSAKVDLAPQDIASRLAQGRLIVRVRMADLSALAWVDQVSQRVSIERDIPSALARAVEPNVPENWLPQHSNPQRALWAAKSVPVGPPADLSMDEPALPRRVVASIVLVQIDAGERSLRAARRSLLAQRGVVEVTFEASDEPLLRPARDADSVLWWREPPERWTPQTRVPFVFEVLR